MGELVNLHPPQTQASAAAELRRLAAEVEAGALGFVAVVLGHWPGADAADVLVECRNLLEYPTEPRA